MESKNYRLESEFNRNVEEINNLKIKRDNLSSLNKYLKYKSNPKRERKINRILNQLESLRKRQISLKNSMS